MTRTWTEAEERWMREHYAEGTINDALSAFKAEFGRQPTKQAMQQKAHRMGLGKDCHKKNRKDPATVRMRWSDPRNADKKRWMLENDTTESVWPTIDKFEAEFGIRLNRSQVVAFREQHGKSRRSARTGGGRTPKPLGAETGRKDGYIYVKVRPEPKRPGTRDNWELKQHVIYKEHHGEIPEGCCVYFADRDITNFDPDNLVAVPRKAIARLNSPDTPEYHDRETLLAALAWIRLHTKIIDTEQSKPRRCGVCGKLFVEDEKQRATYAARAQTCRACLDKGLKARGNRKPKGEATCAVCGETFRKERNDQRRCRACIDAAPKHSADNQKHFKPRESA